MSSKNTLIFAKNGEKFYIFVLVMKVKFYLQNTKENTPTPIYLSVNYGPLFRYSIGKKVSPNQWMTEIQRVSNIDDTTQELNDYLDLMEAFVRALRRNHQQENKPLTNDVLKEELDRQFKPHRQPHKPHFFPFIDHFIEQAALTKKSSTVQTYHATVKRLKDFEKTMDYPLTFDTINMVFYQKFVSFLRHQKKLKDNSIGKHIKNMKLFMHAAYKKRLTHNSFFLSKDFKILKETKKRVYLTTNELQKLHDADLSQHYNLQKIRDVFLIGALTGLHFKQIYQVSSTDWQNDSLTIQSKQKQDILLPIHWTVKEILAKYQYETPKLPTTQTFNKHIKLIGQLANINDLCDTKTGKSVPKYELLTTQTARISFFANAYIQGVPVFDLLQLSGHPSEKAFHNYISIAPQPDLTQHRFFQEFKKV